MCKLLFAHISQHFCCQKVEQIETLEFRSSLSTMHFSASFFVYWKCRDYKKYFVIIVMLKFHKKTTILRESCPFWVFLLTLMALLNVAFLMTYVALWYDVLVIKNESFY